VTAAQPGRVVNLTAAVGQFAQPGTSLTMFVRIDLGDGELQGDSTRPHAARRSGEARDHAYPERKITVMSRACARVRTAFSLLPAQNATGNYVKIVQRVPVKIIMDNPPADVALGPGMSVVPTVRCRLHLVADEKLRRYLELCPHRNRCSRRGRRYRRQSLADRHPVAFASFMECSTHDRQRGVALHCGGMGVSEDEASWVVTTYLSAQPHHR